MFSKSFFAVISLLGTTHLLPVEKCRPIALNGCFHVASCRDRMPKPLPTSEREQLRMELHQLNQQISQQTQVCSTGGLTTVNLCFPSSCILHCRLFRSSDISGLAVGIKEMLKKNLKCIFFYFSFYIMQ